MSPTDLQDSTKNTERNQIEKTAKPPGRPRKYNTEQKVKRRNITVTDKTWEAIEQISKFFELGSRSELLEKISGKTLQVINPIEEIRFPPIDEMPVLPRLLSLLQKTAYLRSILSFARLVAISVGLNKDRYEKEELIEKVVINAVIFVALRDYSYPDYIVSSALADIRWLIFRQLTSKAEISLDIDACKSIQLEFNPKKL